MRTILGVVGGLAAWVVIVGLASMIMRAAWPEYARVAETMTFTLSMQFTRLAVGALSTLAAGWATAVIARRSKRAALMPGVLLLIAFIPQHIILWDKFPVWYHLTFLLSLVPLSLLGGKIGGGWETTAAAQS